MKCYISLACWLLSLNKKKTDLAIISYEIAHVILVQLGHNSGLQEAIHVEGEGGGKGCVATQEPRHVAFIHLDKRKT